MENNYKKKCHDDKTMSLSAITILFSVKAWSLRYFFFAVEGEIGKV